MQKRWWLGFLLFLILIGLFFIPQNKNKLSYSMIDTPIDNGIQQLKTAKNGQIYIIILRETGCYYCKKDERIIVANTISSIARGNKVLTFDLAKMDKQQKKFLKTNFKPILYQNKYLTTPTVFVAVKKQNLWKITFVENTGDLARIKQILNL